MNYLGFVFCYCVFLVATGVRKSIDGHHDLSTYMLFFLLDLECYVV